jgi:NTP pyrophosphatase (non-canonical NTP hydrolase)
MEIDWFQQVGDEIHANKLRHGWKVTKFEDWEDRNEVPAVLALIHSEVSEALEAFRKNDFENFKEELADVMIRVMGLAHGMEIDLKAAILAKVEKNRGREYKHGGKRI